MKILQCHFGSIDPIRQHCMDSVDKYFKGYEVIRHLLPEVDDPIRQSNMHRWKMHYIHVPSLYIDTDVEFFSFMSMNWDRDKPAFAQINSRADNFISYLPNKESVDRFFEIRRMRDIQPVWGWQNKVIREFPHQIIADSPEWKHHRLSGREAGLTQHQLPLTGDYFNYGGPSETESEPHQDDNLGEDSDDNDLSPA